MPGSQWESPLGLCWETSQSPSSRKKLVAATISEFGSLDIIVNNAGYVWDNVIQKMTDEQYQAMLDIHLVAPFRILRGIWLDTGGSQERGGPRDPRYA